MDPNETLVDALLALLDVIDGERPANDSQDDKDAAADKLEDLAEWLRKGGFGPMISHKPYATATHTFYLRGRRS